MDVAGVMEKYLAALASHDVDDLAALTADDLRFISPVGELRKAEFLALMRGLFAGFPDWTFDHGRLRMGWDHATVELRMQGTHTGTLELPVPGLPAIPPSGKVVVLPSQRVQYTLSQGRIVRIEPEPVPGGGIISGVLEQLGVSPPGNEAE
jgi:predicted ester cyclase